jgi:hypothetical protein
MVAKVTEVQSKIAAASAINYSELLHRLCREPHSYTVEQAGNLTIYQARMILTEPNKAPPPIPQLPKAGGKSSSPPRPHALNQQFGSASTKTTSIPRAL